jgi:hypothetical protein
MQSSSLLNEGTPTPLGSEKRGGSDKSEMSKQLFAQINWQEILRAGVFLSHKDVRTRFIINKRMLMFIF